MFARCSREPAPVSTTLGVFFCILSTMVSVITWYVCDPGSPRLLGCVGTSTYRQSQVSGVHYDAVCGEVSCRISSANVSAPQKTHTIVEYLCLGRLGGGGMTKLHREYTASLLLRNVWCGVLCSLRYLHVNLWRAGRSSGTTAQQLLIGCQQSRPPRVCSMG